MRFYSLTILTFLFGLWFAASANAEVSQEELKTIEAAVNMSPDILGGLIYCREDSLTTEYLRSLRDAVSMYPRIDHRKVSAFISSKKSEAEAEAERLNWGGLSEIDGKQCEKYIRWAKKDIQKFNVFVIKN